MAITSASTQDDIVAEYLDNASYDVDGDVDKARLFVVACRALLAMHPSAWSQSSVNMQFNPTLWQQQLRDAQQWVASQGATGGGVKHFEFTDFRS